MDKSLVQFVLDNYLTLTIAFTFLKGVAKITPWAWDDSIASLLLGTLKTFRDKNGNQTQS